MSEEAVINSINSVADAFEENSNRIGVDLYGVTLSNEEFAKLAQDRLDELERGEKKRSSSRSSRRSKEDQEAKQEKQKALDRLKTLQELVNAEVERNMTEEELLTKRLNDKLRELELDKDITTMTEQELAARTALYDKYNDDIQAIRDKADEEERLAEQKRNDEKIKSIKAAFDEQLSEIDAGLKMQLLVNETAHLNELRNFQGTEEQKIELQKQFQADSLELQKASDTRPNCSNRANTCRRRFTYNA